MKIKTSELTGLALDWAVAKCEGVTLEMYAGMWWADPFDTGTKQQWRVSSNWLQGGPIIKKEEIGVYTQYPRAGKCVWFARHKGSIKGAGPTPLIAAMRCYVASKMGEEIDVPEELV